MMNIWIEESGTIKESEMRDKITSFKGADYYIAMYTDAFQAGEIQDFSDEHKDKLLEIRIFGESAELLLRRSMLATDFHYRIASDQARSENYQKCKQEEGNQLPDQEEMTYYISHQLLDINEKKIVEKGNQLQLFTTVGGAYSLPIKKEWNSIKVMNYISYDEKGVATVSDHRLCGFAKKEVQNG